MGVLHRQTILILVLTSAASVLLSASVSAQPITANVIGAKVGKQHKTGGEYRSGYETDADQTNVDGRFTDRLDLFYNPLDGIQFRVFFNRVTPPEDDWKWTSLFIEPAFQLFNAKKHGFDGVLLTGLTLGIADTAANQGRVIFAGEVPIGQWRFRHNSIVAHQFGDLASGGVMYEMRWRVTYQIADHLKGGLEMFNKVSDLLNDPSSFDESMNRAGVVMEGKIRGGLGFQAGILRGISTVAPDWAAKMWLNYQI